MYLTRMHLNPARRGTRFLLSSPQRLHAAVLSGFPPGLEAPTSDGRVLWRLDQGRDHSTTLYVSSPLKPDLTHLVEQAGWPSADASPWQSVQTDGLLERLAAGQRWMFRLTANPVANVRAPDGGRGRRIGLTLEEQVEWLHARAERNGFRIPGGVDKEPQVVVAARRAVTFSRSTEGSTGEVTLSMATYDGVLEVVDAELLSRALGHGIGRAKGYGCGLMTLAPPR